MDEAPAVRSGGVQETLFLPLCGRAMETKRSHPRLMDEKAVEIVSQLDYDFETIVKGMNPMSQLGWVARSLHTDRRIREFLRAHPRATIVNIGCGMDTTFDRIDNGEILFYELDLPDVIELRRSFFEDTERHRSIASSFLDTEWFEQIAVRDGLLCVAGGVFCYFDEAEVKGFFTALADRFGTCELYFDAISPMGVKIAKKYVLKAGGMEMSGDGWGLKNPRVIETWDPRFRVVEAFPMYRGMKRGTPLKVRLGTVFTDTFGIGSMVHLRLAQNDG